MKKYPPKIAEWILAKLLQRKNKISILGDFEEIYNHHLTEKNMIVANCWYWSQIFRSLPSFILNNFYWTFIMMNNYIKVSFRYLKRNKVQSVINIFGLAFGITACLFILLVVRFELSFDDFHQDSDRIFRIVTTQQTETGEIKYATTPSSLANALKKDFSNFDRYYFNRWSNGWNLSGIYSGSKLSN
jgi:putative ABC transport system permease protein